MDVIDRINLRLSMMGKNGAEMSRDLGLSNSTYSQWNTRKSRPSSKTLSLIAPYLETTVEYLLTGEQKETPVAESGEPLPEITQKLIETVKKMNLDQQYAMMGFIETIENKRGEK